MMVVNLQTSVSGPRKVVAEVPCANALSVYRVLDYILLLMYKERCQIELNCRF